ncbi:MAG TPA: hypothetical protein VGK10_03555 [Prolixibacteraceae bacterium]|jgi:hypothetical protein
MRVDFNNCLLFYNSIVFQDACSHFKFEYPNSPFNPANIQIFRQLLSCPMMSQGKLEGKYGFYS